MIPLVIFLQEATKTFRIWIDFVYLVCSFHECRSSNEVLSLICTQLCFMPLRSMVCLLENSYGIMLVVNADS